MTEAWDIYRLASLEAEWFAAGAYRGRRATVGAMPGIDLWARAELEARLASERLSLGKRLVLDERMMASNPDPAAA